jgi:glutamate dehydrogenase/leucine dehydrogenase
MGATVVAITDVFGGVRRDEGLDVAALKRHLGEHGTVAGAPGTTAIDNAELLGLDVDVLVLAAMEGQVTERNASTIRARILAEGANGPVTPEADRILEARGVISIPDILCNAGGVIASYFEWAQNRAALAWTLEEVNARLERQILAAMDAVWQRAAEDRISRRLAAHAIAVERVVEALRLRGLYP